MLVYGGANGGGLNTGGSYNLITDSWTPMTITAAPTATCFQCYQFAWTGAKLIVWGGCENNVSYPGSLNLKINTGGLYAP